MSNDIAASRLTGIGASQVSALTLRVGDHDVPPCNPWLHKSQLYMQALGLAKDHEPSFEMRIGVRCEDVIRDIYGWKTGRTCVPCENQLYRHSEHPFIVCHPDGYVPGPVPNEEDQYDPAAWDRVVEMKVAGPHNWREWGKDADAVPAHYWLQCQHQMLVLGQPRCDLAVLCGTEFRVYELTAAVKVHAAIVTACTLAWEDIECARKEITAGGARRDEAMTILAEMAKHEPEDLAAALGRVYPILTGKLEPCPVEILKEARWLVEQVQTEKAAAANILELKNKLALHMKEIRGYVLDTGDRIERRKMAGGAVVVVTLGKEHKV